MAKVKRTNAAVRTATVAVSVLAGLGIWFAVARPQHSTTTATVQTPPPAANPSFSPNDSFLAQSPSQSTAGGPSQYTAPRNTTPRLRTRAS